jgi:hypothetical protein
MPSCSLSELYTTLAPEADETLPESPPEVGHFNMFYVADLMLASRSGRP